MEQQSALLAVSFGTSYPETRERTIGAVEKDLQKAMPDRKFYRAWTSRFIRKRVLEKEGIRICSVEEALLKMQEDGISDVLVQPTHMLSGEEYARTKKSILDYKDAFERMALGRPLLSEISDLPVFAALLEKECAALPDYGMTVWMGHGSAGLSFPVYDLLNEQFQNDGYPNMCVGTVEYEPGIEPVLQKIRENHPEKVILMPLLLVAGDHALHDMAGDHPESWKVRIESEGARVTCLVKGLGEYESVRKLYVDHAICAEVL